MVHLTREHPAELCASETRFKRWQLPTDFAHDAVVFLRRTELEHLLRVIDVARELLDLVDLLLDAGPLPGHGLRFLRIVPEVRGERGLVQAIDVVLELRDVKDAPLAP